VALTAAGEGPQLLRQRIGGEGPGGQHRDLSWPRQFALLAALHRHQRMGLEGGGEGGAVAAPVHRQGATGGHGVLVGGANHQGAEPPQFLLEQPGGPVATQGPKAIAADQLGKLSAVVGGGAAHRPHLHQPHLHSCLGHLPGSLGSRQAGPNHQHLWIPSTRVDSRTSDWFKDFLVWDRWLSSRCGEISRGTHHTGQEQCLSR